ncbi:MAG: hypothetical protein ACOYXR_06605 [Nitrospirota bacterium]
MTRVSTGVNRLSVSKGDKDRVTMLPSSVIPRLTAHLERVRTQHEADVAAGFGRVMLPHALASKYPHADRDWGWQWVFPARTISVIRARANAGGITCMRPYRHEPSAT